MSSDEPGQVVVGQPVRKTPLWEHIALIACIAIIVLSYLSKSTSAEVRAAMWLFGFGIIVFIVVMQLWANSPKKIDIYDLATTLSGKEKSIANANITHEDFAKFEVYPLTGVMLLVSYPSVPITLYYDLARGGIVGRSVKTIEQIVSGVEKSELSKMAYKLGDKSEVLRLEAEKQGVHFETPISNQNG